jgi:hypothetical protein
MTIRELVDMTLAQSAARARGRVGAATIEHDPEPVNLRLARNIAESGEDFSEDEIRWAASAIGVQDTDAFMVELESWL